MSSVLAIASLAFSFCFVSVTAFCWFCVRTIRGKSLGYTAGNAIVCRDDREIYEQKARLTFAGAYSQREIATAAGCSRGLVVKVQKALRLCNIDAKAALPMSEQEPRGPSSRGSFVRRLA